MAKTFGVSMSDESKEYCDSVLKLYRSETGEKAEDTLLRIMQTAEKEHVRGTHPALEPVLEKVDATIDTLIKQINGIIAGQDAQIADLKDQVAKSVQMRQQAAEAARNAEAKAEAIVAEAEAKMKALRLERDQAVREMTDARTIADEKTASNDLLMRQLASLQADVDGYGEMKKTFNDLAEKARALEEAKKDAERMTEAVRADYESRMRTTAVEATLEKERAVIETERAFQERLREADKEVARLQAKVETMEARIKALET